MYKMIQIYSRERARVEGDAELRGSAWPAAWSQSRGSAAAGTRQLRPTNTCQQPKDKSTLITQLCHHPNIC